MGMCHPFSKFSAETLPPVHSLYLALPLPWPTRGIVFNLHKIHMLNPTPQVKNCWKFRFIKQLVLLTVFNFLCILPAGLLLTFVMLLMVMMILQLYMTAWRFTSDVRNCTTLMQRKLAARWENCQLMEQLIACWSEISALNHELLCLTTTTGDLRWNMF